MIARVWHGVTPEALADKYLEHVRRVVLAGCRAVPGNRGALVFAHISNGAAEFLVISIWDSYDAIRKYTGSDDINASVYHDEDLRCLVFPEPRVTHYSLVMAEHLLPQGIFEKNPFEGTA